MIRRDIKKLLVEYDDGSVEMFKEEGMFHVARQDFPRGATRPEQHFTSHLIRWIDPKPPFPPPVEVPDGQETPA